MFVLVLLSLLVLYILFTYSHIYIYIYIYIYTHTHTHTRTCVRICIQNGRRCIHCVHGLVTGLTQNTKKGLSKQLPIQYMVETYLQVLNFTWSIINWHHDRIPLHQHVTYNSLAYFPYVSASSITSHHKVTSFSKHLLHPGHPIPPTTIADVVVGCSEMRFTST